MKRHTTEETMRLLMEVDPSLVVRVPTTDERPLDGSLKTVNPNVPAILERDPQSPVFLDIIEKMVTRFVTSQVAA